MRENGQSKGIYIDFINGYTDHVHCFISLGTDQTLEKIMQLIKGESSFWINKNRLGKTKFEWQDEYFAVGVVNQCLKMPENIFLIKKFITAQKALTMNLKSF
jgi:putative transposase